MRKFELEIFKYFMKNGADDYFGNLENPYLCHSFNACFVKDMQISASADGGPRSRVCAR